MGPPSLQRGPGPPAARTGSLETKNSEKFGTRTEMGVGMGPRAERKALGILAVPRILGELAQPATASVTRENQDGTEQPARAVGHLGW